MEVHIIEVSLHCKTDCLCATAGVAVLYSVKELNQIWCNTLQLLSHCKLRQQVVLKIAIE